MQVDLSRALNAAQTLERTEGQAAVRGATGSGVHSLADVLAARERWVVLELREAVHVDATPALMLELLSHLETKVRDEFADLAAPDAPARLVQALNETNKCFALIVPHDVESITGEEALRRPRRNSLLRELTRLRRLLVLGGASSALESVGFSPRTVIELPFPQRPVNEVPFPSGKFAEAAAQLGSLMNAMQASPLVWRLAVGLLSLGAHAQGVAALCQRSPGEAINGLAAELARRLKDDPRLLGAVQKLLALRRSINVSALAALTGLPSEDLPLLTHCIGYNEPVRTSLTVREALRHELGLEKVSGPSQAAFAAHYKQFDGARSPFQTTSPQQMTAWIERAHHLAHAGSAGQTDWCTLDLPAPELYWDRAFHLSVELHDYVGAAEVYEACARRFTNDDYSAHYAAWNRWLAGERTHAVSDQLGRAVLLAPRHTWWNARHIEALIELGAFSEARAAWARALLHIDPDGSRSRSSESLLRDLYLQVADAWVRKDCWHDALKTLGRLAEVFKYDTGMKETLARIEQARAKVWGKLWAWVRRKPTAEWTRASALLERLEQEVDGLPVPSLGEAEEGAPSLTWSSDDALLTLQLERERPELYWYAADRRQQGSVDGTSPDVVLTAELRGWLTRISHV